MVNEYYVALYNRYPVEYIGPFKSRKETGKYNRKECGGSGHTYHYQSHRLKPFTGKVTAPETFSAQKEKPQ